MKTIGSSLPHGMVGMVAAAWLSSGCYVYTSAPEPEIPSGTEVRAQLSPAQDFPMGEIVVRDVTGVEGVVFNATSDTLALWSQWLRTAVGSRFGTDGSVLYLERTAVPTVERRTLHPARTVVALAITVGVGAGVFSFLADPGGDEVTDPRTDPIGIRVVAPIRQ